MSASKHLLVIRLSAMGDVAMTVPVLSALEKQYPDLQITVLTKDFFKPIFSQLANVKVYVADIKGKHKGVLGLLKLYKELKTLKIDAVADLHNVLRSNILKCYFMLGGFPFEQIEKGRAEKKALTASENKVFKPLKTTHQRYADVFAALNLPLDLTNASFLPKRLLSEKTEKLFESEKGKLLGIAPFAAFEGKMYPLDLTEQVVSQLSPDNRVLLFGGGEKERKQLEAWEKHFPNTVSIVGKLTFSEELDLISNLDMMLAMDSGNAHLASIFGIPTVTLWGVTHPYAGFYPFGQDIENALLSDREKFPLIPTSVYGNKMPDGYSESMRTILPEDILRKINTILEK
ncbi:glycosyltransferase family 9 protein [Maribacter algarum]|uniref:Glycosyltransferase family 9 protein n=1 Tax=Maribacter algarum (ex Zhang et al. 2020) TaxID=2578118 RepID=A0A5S3PVF8_9FLAO|nr:glycosyltransferase family 9 protein [Maribacter algarum]TMM58930.1 glycosyltransferase family 9 protein [Maribacter algarum]